jgi:hypothetical protein
MIISAYIGVAGLSDVGYRFYTSAEAPVAARATGVTDAGGGWYSIDTTIPSTASSVRWDSTGTPTAVARQYFDDKTGFSLVAAYDPAKTAASPAQVQSELGTYGALKPTVTARTLDVSTTGEAGIDWANIGAPTTTVALTGTTVGLTSAGVDSVWNKTMTELSAVPGVTASMLAALEWVFLLSRNKINQTSTTQTIRNDADSATIGTSVVSDDGTTFTRGKLT